MNTTPGTATVIGEFDPFHVGHRQLIEAATRVAGRLGAPLRPLVLDRGESDQLTTVDERIRHFAELGIDAVTVIEAGRADAERTVRAALCDLGARVAVLACAPPDGAQLIWPNVRTLLRELSVEVIEVPRPTDRHGTPVTSDLVRQRLAAGDVAEVATLLARPFSISGVVCRGDARGRTIGFPTANLTYAGGTLWPSFGVYASWVTVDDERHPAAVNIGTRPTVYGASGVPLLEAHLLDFDGDLYDRRISVHFIARIRGEQRFNSLDELEQQLASDVRATRSCVAAHQR